MAQITFNRPDGKECSGFYVEPPAGTRAPGVVVIQEWWGVNDQIKGVAQRFADQGYRVVVPDLYRGKATVEAKEAEHLMGGLNFADAASHDIRGAVQHLKKTSAQVGVTGFCMGGALAMLSAMLVPEADAVAVWYGFPPIEYIDASKIRMPLLGHFATEDAYFPIAHVDELEKRLTAAGVRYTFHRYNAQHAFANEMPKGPDVKAKYDQSAAETAWQRTLAFFGQHLAVAQHA